MSGDLVVVWVILLQFVGSFSYNTIEPAKSEVLCAQILGQLDQMT